MSPEERKHLSTKISGRIKELIESESEKLGLSQTEYIEKLVDGTLPGRLEKQMEEMRHELLAKIEELKK